MSACVPGFDLNEAPAATPTRAAKPKPNDASVVLRGVRVELNSSVGSAFVIQCARNRERLISDERIIEQFDITPDDWTAITQNKALRLLVTSECERRTLNGDAAKEAAAKIFLESPEAMGSILRDNKASPRARVAASQELRATARSDEKAGTETDRVVISINLGADVKPIVVDSGPLPPKRAVQENLDAE